jgi:hypothetical protein
MGTNKNEFPLNPIVEKLLSQGEGPLVALKGYVGPSTGSTVRLYDSITLGSYTDVPKNAVITTTPGSSDADPTTLYIRSGVVLIRRVIQDMTFLAGQAGSVGSTVAPTSITECAKVLDELQQVTRKIAELRTMIPPRPNLEDDDAMTAFEAEVDAIMSVIDQQMKKLADLQAYWEANCTSAPRETSRRV